MNQPCRAYKRPGIPDERVEREKRIRAMASRHIPEWDAQWGGPKPYSEDELRRKAGLPEKCPPPWYKRVARFYDETWEKAFEGTGPAIYTILLFLSLALAYAAIGRATGWWGGAW